MHAVGYARLLHQPTCRKVPYHGEAEVWDGEGGNSAPSTVRNDAMRHGPGMQVQGKPITNKTSIIGFVGFVDALRQHTHSNGVA
jgi:hypothetical protein